MGEIIYEIRKEIQAIQLELDALDPISDMPELITSANLLRSNEYLTKVTKKQSELLSAYDNYSKALEEMLDSVFDIQQDLTTLLKEQSKLIPDKKSRIIISENKKTKRKPSKK